MVHHTQKVKSATCNWFWADGSHLKMLDFFKWKKPIKEPTNKFLSVDSTAAATKICEETNDGQPAAKWLDADGRPMTVHRFGQWDCSPCSDRL